MAPAVVTPRRLCPRKPWRCGTVDCDMRSASVRHIAVNLAFARSITDPTDEWTTLAEVGLEHPERVPYTSSPWWTLHWLLPRSLVKPEDVSSTSAAVAGVS